jgi:hypothetical protein
MIVTVTTKEGIKQDVDHCGECPNYIASPVGLGWCDSEYMDIADTSVVNTACPFNYKGNVKEG